ncbi:2-oxo acid dehydrogenase subunit E2 [Microtetraspora glauca]|uniref:Dihydrolipoamide acetyltransferase component of pyruvate dehydrogenase complex n=1 Tax=Microtetraspora glauca TaxID=1996 RepID=A0ABV3GS10_MICGL
MSDFRVPKLNNNDAAYVLVEWLAKDGDAVRAGDPLVTVETSKTVEELAAEEAGVLRRLVREGAECAPGQTIARLFAPGDEPPGDEPPGGDPPAGTGGDDIVITAPARRLIDELGISPDRIRALGRKVVRRADLEGLVAGPVGGATGEQPPDVRDEHDTGELIALSRAQRRTAEVVERSRREIPSAFTLMNVDVTDALPVTRDLTRRHRVLVGVPELVVKAVGGLLDVFPLFFASPAPGPHGLRARRAAGADVGVTVDVGKGLFIPVVRDAAGRSVAEIARDLTGFRRTALEGSFRERDLRGGAITLTLHTYDGIVMAAPIVFPGQTCALALTAPRPEVVQEGDGFAVRKICGLGLSYDHRFINGREAAEFLGALRIALENPGHFNT